MLGHCLPYNNAINLLSDKKLPMCQNSKREWKVTSYIYYL